jgi:hypothetical protein
MKLTINIREESGYLLFNVAGEWELESLKELADLVAREAKKRGYVNILADLSNLTGTASISDRFKLGKYVVPVIGNLRIGVISQSEYISKFGENIVVNRGATAGVFSNRENGLQWLLKDYAENLDVVKEK